MLAAFRADPQAYLKEGARAGDARGSRRPRNVMAVGKMALAMVLLDRIAKLEVIGDPERLRTIEIAELTR